MPQHLSKGEFDALIKQIVIPKSGKGNSIVIVDRDKYIEKMENFLSNQSKFQKIAAKGDNFLILLPVKKIALIKFIKTLFTLIACLKKHEDI